MLIESDPHQIRTAVLEDGQLVELFVERVRRRGLVGNVYQGRVTRVLPGMQAAFVNIGLERDAFLYVSDVRGAALEVELDDPALGEAATVGEEPPATPRRFRTANIGDLLNQGQEVLVQVVKDPLPNKGARISNHITLPGRYLVLLPTTRDFAVSRRIESEEERQRLLGLLEEVAPSPDTGLIVRTVGEGKGRAEFEADVEYLAKLWQGIHRRAASAGAPSLIHHDLDLARRVVRDIFSSRFSELWVEGDDCYERVRHFLEDVQPGLLDRLHLFEGEETLFQHYRIDEEIEATLKSRVWLKSGGYLVIHPTEALVAIDVNTGRFVGSRDLEETVLRTNLEAVREVVRQIRLRDLGGIIVLDLIDMIEEEHQQQVLAVLEEELEKDRAKSKMLGISEFGLVELTRKRTRPSLGRQLTQPCPYCRGRGRIKSLSTICLGLRRRLLDRFSQRRPDGLRVRLHPEVARALVEEERAILDELEQAMDQEIHLESDPSLHQERFEIVET